MSGVNDIFAQETKPQNTMKQTMRAAAIEKKKKKWVNKSCHTTLLCIADQQKTTLTIPTEIMQQNTLLQSNMIKNDIAQGTQHNENSKTQQFDTSISGRYVSTTA